MKKIVSILVIVVVIISLLSVTCYNVSNNPKFWEISVYQIASLAFAIFVTYLLTQKKNDIRRKKEMLDKMIEGIQKDISEKDLVMYATEEERIVALLQQKSLANRLEYLKKASVCANINEEVKYLSEEMEHLREFYGAHMTDKEYMEKSSMDIKKYIVNISDKCFSIRLKLYEI